MDKIQEELKRKFDNLFIFYNDARRNDPYDTKRLEQQYKYIQDKLENYKPTYKDDIKEKLQRFERLVKGVRLPQKHHHDLEGFIKQGKDGAENLIHKNEYVMDAELARKIFGSYFDDYQKKKKEAEQKEKDKEEEKKPQQLYDLNILPNLQKANEAIQAKMTDAFDNLKQSKLSKVAETSHVAYTWYILGVIILLCMFVLLFFYNVGGMRWMWAITSTVPIITLILLFMKYPNKAKWLGYTSIPLVAVILMSIALFALLYYVYSYLKNTAAFSVYGTTINTVFATLSAFIVLFIFATVKVVDFRNIIGKSEEDMKDGTSKAVNVLKEYVKYSLSLFGGFVLVALSTWLVLKLTSNNEFLSMFLSIMFVLFSLVTVLYVVYIFVSKITLPDSPIANLIGKIFKLIYHLFFAIPCIFYELFLNAKGTPKFVYKILAAQIAIVVGYIFIPRLWKWIRERGHIYIQKDAVKLNIKKSYMNWYQLYNSGVAPSKVENLSMWEKVKDTFFKEEKNFMDYMKEQVTVPKQDFKYEYSLGLELFLHNLPPNTSHLGNQFVRVFSFGEKPSIWYKSNTQEIQFRSVVYRLEKERLKPEEKTLFTMKIAVQKWNPLKINYKDGVMDIFLEDELVHTQDSIVPYIENDEIYSGQTDGIHGGIRNIVYYNEIQK